MAKIRNLAFETAIYGIPSIVGRFLNYLLVPLYTYTLATENYGIVSNLYGWIAFILVLLTFGMETGFFRFASDKGNEKAVFGTSFTFVAGNSVLLIALVILFKNPISEFLNYTNYVDLVVYTAFIVAFDALCAIPFAKLRLEKKAVLFASLKMINIGINIFFNVFFFVVYPYLIQKQIVIQPFVFIDYLSPQIFSGYLIQFVFVSNLLASGITLLLLFIFSSNISLSFDKKLFKSLLYYSFPILIVGLAGMINMYGDRIIYPFLFDDTTEASRQLGIYSANYKIGVLMVLFTQAFRYAYEPFIFNQQKNDDAKVQYSAVMKHFVWFEMLIFLFVMVFLPYIQFMIGGNYREGLMVVPIVLLANFLSGVFFNLSVWYKLTDKTRFGAYFAVLGSVVVLTINIVFVPLFGYIASAWAGLVSNLLMVAISFYFMRKHYPIHYPIFRIVEYIFLAMVLWVINIMLGINREILANIVHILSVLLYIGYYVKRENILRNYFKHGRS